MSLPWCCARRASTSARAPTSAEWARRGSAASTGRRSGSSAAVSRSSRPCRAARSAVASGWPCPRTSGSPPPRPRPPPTSPRLGFHQGFALSVTLPRAVGPQRAQDLLLTGRPVSGEEAAIIGLCDAVADDPPPAPAALATAIAASAPLSVPSIRATLRRPLVSEVSAALDLEADAQAALLDTADFAEGIAASIGKRPPQFAG